MLGNCRIDILPGRTSRTRVYSPLCIYGNSEIYECEVFLRIFVVQRLLWSIGGVSISTNYTAIYRQDSTILLLQKFSSLGIDFSKLEKKNIPLICWHVCGAPTDSKPKKLVYFRLLTVNIQDLFMINRVWSLKQLRLQVNDHA